MRWDGPGDRRSARSRTAPAPARRTANATTGDQALPRRRPGDRDLEGGGGPQPLDGVEMGRAAHGHRRTRVEPGPVRHGVGDGGRQSTSRRAAGGRVRDRLVGEQEEGAAIPAVPPATPPPPPFRDRLAGVIRSEPAVEQRAERSHVVGGPRRWLAIAEAAQHGTTVVTHQHVRGIQPPVHDPHVVEVGERGRDARGERGDPGDGERSAGRRRPSGVKRAQLPTVVRRSVLHERDHAGVARPLEPLTFPSEALPLRPGRPLHHHRAVSDGLDADRRHHEDNLLKLHESCLEVLGGSLRPP